MNVISIITIDNVELEVTIAKINQKFTIAVTVSEFEGDTEINYSG